MSGSTAADGEKVVAALDRLWAKEEYRDHGQLREALFKSIHSALKLGLERGWIPKPVQKPERKDRATKSTVPAGHLGDEPDRDLEGTDETGDTAHGVIDVADAAPDPAPAETKTPTPPTGSTPDRDRQPPPMLSWPSRRSPLHVPPPKTHQPFSHPRSPRPARPSLPLCLRPRPTPAKAASPSLEKSLRASHIPPSGGDRREDRRPRRRWSPLPEQNRS